MDCRRRPHLPKICAQSDRPFRKHRFPQISLNSAADVIASKKVKSLIGSRQCAFHRAIDEPCVLGPTPEFPKGWLKREFFTFAFHFFVAGNRRHFKFGMYVKSQPTDDKLSLKGAWPLSRDLFNFWKIRYNISKMVQDSLTVSVKFERKSFAVYRMVMFPKTLGDP